MPLYEFKCVDCGRLTEVLQRLSDPPLAQCPECGGAVEKQLSAPSFQFKGSGWYVTDYARKDKPGAKTAGDKGDKGDTSDKGDKGDKSDKGDKGGGEKSSSGGTDESSSSTSAKSDAKSKPASGSASD